jgi:hypothetical protein
MLNGRSLAAATTRTRRVGRHVIAVAACALVAHTAAYGELMPRGGTHGYVAWYAPLVAVLSGVAVLGTLVALTVAFVLGPSSTLAGVVRASLPPASREDTIVGRLLALGTGAVTFFALQESLEASLADGRTEFAGFTPPSLAIVAVAILVTAAAIALVERAVSSLVSLVLRNPRPRPKPARAGRARLTSSTLPRAARPLAIHGGLRAPPVAF